MNILDMLKDQVTGTLAKQASGFLGESEGAVSSALGSAFPAILGSVIEKGTSKSGAEGLMGMMDGLDLGMLGNIGNIFGGGASSVNGLLNSGGGILDMLLGDKLGGVADLIAKVAGLKSGSSSSLLKMAAPFLLGMIGKQIKGKGIGALMDLLGGQKKHVASALPSGMGDLLGLGFAANLGDGLKDAASKVTGAATDAASKIGSTATGAASAATGAATRTASAAVDTAGQAASSGLSFLKWLLPLLLIGGAAYFLTQGGCSKAADAATGAVGSAVDKTKEVAGDAAGTVANAADAAAKAAGAAFGKVDEAAKAALDKVSFVAGSAGKQMMDFIDGGFKGDGLFRFQNVNFNTGSAALTPESMSEVDNLASILKAYPGVKVEIHGYTDNTGNADKNVDLSKMRAASVRARLIGQDVAAGQIVDSKGFGAENPIADNGTAEGRAQNRRIEVKLVK